MSEKMEDREYMGTKEQAENALITASRSWRETRQPIMGTKAGLKAHDAGEHELRFRLANAAVLWLWHQENPEAASSPAQEPVTTEPVAWTNEAQLGFLKESEYRVVPMAMWAFQHSAHPIALYAIPAPPQPGREDSELEELVAQAIWEECCPGMKWGQIDHLIYCRMAGAAIARMRALTGEPK